MEPHFSPPEMLSEPENMKQLPSGRNVPAGDISSTPVSSLPSSKSLMRHLSNLRKRQQTQRSKLEESIQLASPCSHDDTAQFNVCVIDNGGNHLKSSQDRFVSESSAESPFSSKESCINYRYPFDEIKQQLHNERMTKYPNSEYISEKRLERDDIGNSPPLIDLNMNDSKPYNPDVYRSPPKNTLNGRKPSKILEFSPKKLQSKTAHKSGYFIELGSKPSANDRPISSMSTSFDELILKNIQKGLYSGSTSAPLPKKNFLRKGAGAARYERSRVSNSQHSAATSSTDNFQCNEIQKLSKLLPGNEVKVKFPFLKKGACNARFNFKPTKIQKKHTAAKNLRLHLGPTAPDRLQILPDNSILNMAPTSDGQACENMNFSPIVKLPRREMEELKAFEKLEELAENASFSSNASDVYSLLQKGLGSSLSSTPINSPMHIRNHPIKSLKNDSEKMQTNRILKVESNAISNQSELNNAHDRNEIPTSVEESPFNRVPPNSKKKNVQFCTQGAEVLEYIENDTESEVPTLSDTSELINVSDLEALNELQKRGQLPTCAVATEYTNHENSNAFSCGSDNESLSCENKQDKYKDYTVYQAYSGNQSAPVKSKPRHTVLTFSPPKVPPQSASYPVWNAFRRKSTLQTRNAELSQGTVSSLGEGEKVNSAKISSSYSEKSTCVKACKRQEELDAHKVLLVSKVHELETEIKSFQMETVQLKKLQNTLEREKEQLHKERILFETTLAEDRRKMEQYFENQQNILWKEKCALEASNQSKEHTGSVLEIINLKEEVLLLKKELKKRTSLHNFTQNKLKDKIKELERQKKDFENKIEKVAIIEKDNLNLKHQVDRMKLSQRLTGQRRSKHTEIEQTATVKAPLVKRSVHFADFECKEELSVLDIQAKNVSTLSTLNVEHSNKTNVSGIPLDTSKSLANECNRALPHTDKSLASAMDSSETTLDDGSTVVTYANGNLKKVLPSGCVVQEYYNGDQKETYHDRVVYTYAESQTKHTSHHDGREDIEYPNGQVESKNPDGSIEILFPDKTKKCVKPNGTELCYCPNGTVITMLPSGEKLFDFVGGQREIHGRDGSKRREYPDGTVKILHEDGSTETKYPDGRVRVKDKHGIVQIHTMMPKHK